MARYCWLIHVGDQAKCFTKWSIEVLHQITHKAVRYRFPRPRPELLNQFLWGVEPSQVILVHERLGTQLQYPTNI